MVVYERRRSAIHIQRIQDWPQLFSMSQVYVSDTQRNGERVEPLDRQYAFHRPMFSRSGLTSI